MFIIASYRAGCTLSNNRTQHVGHQVSRLFGEYLLRIYFMLINNFTLRIYDLLDHIGIAKSTIVAD
ncbi:hypothetical protein D3C86_2051060 [compost metagenome]